MIRTHEDAVNRARFDTKCAEHALRIIDRKVVDAEAFADRAFFFFDVDAINRTSDGALFAADACGEVEAVETSVSRFHWYRHLRVFVDFGEGPTLIRLQHRPEGNEQSLCDRRDGEVQVAKPVGHCFAASVVSCEFINAGLNASSVHRPSRPDYRSQTKGRKCCKHCYALLNYTSLVH